MHKALIKGLRRKTDAELKADAELQEAIDKLKLSLPVEERQLYHNGTERSLPKPCHVAQLTQFIDVLTREKTGRCFGPRLEGFLTNVQKFVTIADVGVGGSQCIPAIAVWGAVRVSLQVLCTAISFFDKLSELLMRVYKEYSVQQDLVALYPSSPELRNASCAYLTGVINLFAAALEYYKKSKAKRILSAGLTAPDGPFKELESILTERARDVERLLHFVGCETGREVLENTSFLLKALHQQSAAQKERARREFLNACSAFNAHTARKYAQQKGLSTWLLHQEEYTRWNEAPSSKVLWCTGIIGSGKSVVMANLCRELQASNSNTATSYFFCRHDDPESLNYRTIIGNIAKQLFETTGTEPARGFDYYHAGELDTDQLEDLIRSLPVRKGPYNILIDGLDDCLSMTVPEQVGRFLARLIQSSRPVFHIYMSTRPDLLSQLAKTVPPHYTTSMKKGHPVLRAYVRDELTRRSEANELSLSDPSHVSLIEDALMSGSEGMFLWVTFQIEAICYQVTEASIFDVLKELPKDLPETFDRVLRRLHNTSKVPLRQKLLAFVAAAKRPLTLDELCEALSVVPARTQRVLENIVNDVPKLLSYGGSLLDVDDEQKTLHFAHPTVRQHLLSTVADDLKMYQINQVESDIQLGEVCVTYLSFPDFETQVSKIGDGESSARDNESKTRDKESWTLEMNAAGLAGSDLASSGMGHVLLKLRGASKRSQLRYDLTKTGRSRQQRNPETTAVLDGFLVYAREYWLLHTRLFHSSQEDCHTLWRRLINGSTSVGTLPWAPEHWSDVQLQCVTWASSCDHYALFQLMLNKAIGEAPFTLKHISLVMMRCASNLVLPNRLSIANSGPVQPSFIDPMQLEDHGSILIGAALTKDLELIETLVKHHGLHVDTQSDKCYFRTALQAASFIPDLKTMRYLVDHGADVNAPGSNFHNALSAACHSSANGTPFSREAVKFLLDRGADVQRRDADPSKFHTPLQAAYEVEDHDVINLLMEHGASKTINTTGGILGSLLAELAGKGDLVSMKRVIDEGADVNLKSDRFPIPPLTTACESMSTKPMQLLIDAGADVNYSSKGTYLESAMMCCADHGFTDGLLLLLRNGADVNEKYEERTSPLWVAADKNHEEMVKLLLEKGADPNVENSSGSRILDWSLTFNRTSIVKHLLDFGADPTHSSDHSSAALDLAKQKSSAEMIEAVQIAIARWEAAH